jgi:hypothetical protein
VFTDGVATPEELAAQAEAVARVRAARVQRDKAVKDSNQRLRAEIIRAVDVGASIRDVAKAAELTRQRVHQILNEPR